MANVLPKEAQKKVSRSFRARFVLAGSLVVLSSALLALLALLPAYAIVYVEKAALSEDAARTDSSGESQDITDRDDILRTAALLQDLSSVASSTSAGIEAMSAALEKRPKGVTVQTIHYAVGEVGTITIGGIALAREGVSTYAASLRSDSRFKGVSVPIGALAGAGDGRFTITLIGAF